MCGSCRPTPLPGSATSYRPSASAGLDVFPDPWHKARHHKRRLLSPDFVDLVASRMRQAVSGGWLPTGRTTPVGCARSSTDIQPLRRAPRRLGAALGSAPAHPVRTPRPRCRPTSLRPRLPPRGVAARQLLGRVVRMRRKDRVLRSAIARGRQNGGVRWRLDISYDGTGFHGWATQPGHRTVQGELEGWLPKVLRLDAPVALTCAGRTDAGVHARGQVAQVDLADDPAVDGDRLVRRLARVLPDDLVVRRVTVAPARLRRPVLRHLAALRLPDRRRGQ